MFPFRANRAVTNKRKQKRAGQLMRVLGIDPGLRNLGWGVIDVNGARIGHVANGICHSTPGPLAPRLLELFDQLTAIFETFRPDTAAVEQTFVNRDGAGTLKLGQARGIAMLVPARAGIPVGEYAPNAVKKAVVGVGHADAADALAIAICHAHHAQSAGRLAQAVERAAG
jgi:crossover junction endodeoxyribonuclease RuvC